MKQFKYHHPEFGYIQVIYGYNHYAQEYFLTVLNPNNEGEDMIVFSIGTFTTLVPYPKHLLKKEWNNLEMSYLWTMFNVPDKDVLLLLSGMSV